MLKRALVVAASLVLAGTGTVALARGGGAGGPGGGHADGMSSQHMGSQGMDNTNGPNAADRDKGLERAEDRMSEQGLAHSKADDAQSTTKHRSPGKKGAADNSKR